MGSWTICAVQVFRSYKKDKTFTLAQMEARHIGRMVIPYNRHIGLILDIPLISPLWAWMAAFTWQFWTVPSLIVAVILSFIGSSVMFNGWTEGSREVIDPCAVDGKARFVGQLHYGYMFLKLPVFMLFFFKTPHLRFDAASWSAGLLAFHVCLGFIQPERYARGYNRKETWYLLAVVLGLIFVGWFWAICHP